MERTRSMANHPPARVLLLILAYVGFVSLGLPDAVLGIAWPSLRAEFVSSQTALGWILAAGASGYFASGLMAGRLIHSAGVGTVLFASTALVVVGVLGYAFAPSVAVFALAAVVVGGGSGAIDSGLNTHAARHFRPGQVAWLHAAYSAGAALGSATMALTVARTGGARGGYALVAALLAMLCVGFFLTRRRWSASEKEGVEGAVVPGDGSGHVAALDAFKMGRVKLGALAFFVYSGVELGAGHWAYSILVQSRGVSASAAGFVVSAYWASIFVGRVLSGFVVERVGGVRLVRYGAIIAAIGAVLFATSALPDFVNAVGLVLVGLAIAPIYPGLMSETPRRMGVGVVAHAVGFQVSAATAGMFALPAMGGVIAERIGLEGTAVFVAACATVLLLLHELLTRLPALRAASGALDANH
jgi:fucose permease